MPSLHRIAAFIVALLFCAVLPAYAANYPDPKEGDWVAKNFKFHTGEVMPEVTLHYRTIGSPSNEAVLVLHGTAGNGSNMLTRAFAEELFGPGQPLDATKYFIILPDALGTGKSTRPSSSGMRMKFPKYNYDDMVQAQYRLVTEGLGIKHLRMVIGNSMGGMQVWNWVTTYPDMRDIGVPMACQPGAMSGRNWMLRRLLAESIRNDPEWNNGNYTEQPPSLRRASVFYATATSGGTLNYQAAAPTRQRGGCVSRPAADHPPVPGSPRPPRWSLTPALRWREEAAGAGR